VLSQLTISALMVVSDAIVKSAHMPSPSVEHALPVLPLRVPLKSSVSPFVVSISKTESIPARSST
jgi:hypothetical protein